MDRARTRAEALAGAAMANEVWYLEVVVLVGWEWGTQAGELVNI